MKKFSISNRLKIISVTLAVIAVFAVSPTLAWLSATTTPVVNYFSGGAIALTLDEAPVGTDGKAIDGDRVQENHYKYMAGAELDKDPTVTVLANSEDCYVYVCVDNELPGNLFSININTTAWTFVSTSGNKTIYRYATSVESSTSNQALTPVFTKVTVSEDLTSDDITALGTKTLTVTAFAIQSESLETDDADDLAEAYFYSGVDVTSLDADETESEQEEEPAETKDTEEESSDAVNANNAEDAAALNESGESASDEEAITDSVSSGDAGSEGAEESSDAVNANNAENAAGLNESGEFASDEEAITNSVSSGDAGSEGAEASAEGESEIVEDESVSTQAESGSVPDDESE